MHVVNIYMPLFREATRRLASDEEHAEVARKDAGGDPPRIASRPPVFPDLGKPPRFALNSSALLPPTPFTCSQAVAPTACPRSTDAVADDGPYRRARQNLDAGARLLTHGFIARSRRPCTVSRSTCSPLL